MRYFCTFIASSVKHPTIKVYLNAIRLQHIELGYPDPTQDTLLQYTVKGIRREQGDGNRVRLPITTTTLRQLKVQLHHTHNISLHDKRMLWAAFTLAFYAFLRSSEFVAPSPHYFDASCTLLLSDVQLHSHQLLLTIRSSKTDPFRQGSTLTVGATSTSTCPVTALRKYLILAPRLPHKPLFQFHNGSYLTRTALTTLLRRLLTQVGVNHLHYASHSFRIGAATTAAAAGIPDWQIQALGRWSSPCYTRYIKTPPSIFTDATRAMAAVQSINSP